MTHIRWVLMCGFLVVIAGVFGYVLGGVGDDNDGGSGDRDCRHVLTPVSGDVVADVCAPAVVALHEAMPVQPDIISHAEGFEIVGDAWLSPGRERFCVTYETPEALELTDVPGPHYVARCTR